MAISNFSDPSVSLLSTCGGDTIKLFDVSLGQGDSCILSYSPSPGHQVYSVKWSHTNMVVASAGEDKKISLWRKNGQIMGTIPAFGCDGRDNLEESIFAINFSNKGSRYICSGGSGKVVRIWDLQRKRCIKWLRGHTDMITGAMYNCKDEHLASISLNGVLILHNLASGAKVAELKDPNQQVLRMLDYSRISRHLLVTSGDDGSIHLWDTTGRSPKVSWLKQHSAPTAGVAFSHSSDKMIASVGLDKKLYTFDKGSRRPSFCVHYETPFSSLAFRDDGWTLAAGTSRGQVVLYDVRGKPQPFSVLCAYGNSEAVTNLSWQRSKPVIVDESSCSPEIALIGGAAVNSVIMPDPLSPVTSSSSLSLSMAVPASKNSGHLDPSTEASSLTATKGGSRSTLNYLCTSEETPNRFHLRLGGTLAKLRAPHSIQNLKDDMDVFSPLVDVQPLTPTTFDKLWNDQEGAKKDYIPFDKKPMALFSSPRTSFKAEGEGSDHPIFNWKSNSTSRQDGTLTSFTARGSSAISSKREDSSVTTPEAWGGLKFSDKFTQPRQPTLSRFGMMAASGLASGSSFSGSQELSSASNMDGSSSSNQKLSFSKLRPKDFASHHDTPLGFSENFPSASISPPPDTKTVSRQANLELPGPAGLTLPRRLSNYAERMSTAFSCSDGTSPAGSPKIKKTGVETREELLNGLFNCATSTVTASEAGTLPMGGASSPQKGPPPDAQQGTSFSLQMIQSTLEETLDSFQKSIHEDMRNLHIEMLRQFHMQETEISSVFGSVLQNQAELMKEIQSLRKENQQLRQLLC